MTPDQAASLLFDDILSCRLSLPCQLHRLDDHNTANAEMRLHAVALVEDGRVEDSEERQEKGVAFQRLEAKLDLLLALCGRLLASQQTALPTTTVQLSPRGLTLSLGADSPLPSSADKWAISLQIADWLPDPATLPVTLLSEHLHEGQRHLYLQFEQPSPGLMQALERHVFRLHRRHVAQQRQAR